MQMAICVSYFTRGLDQGVQQPDLVYSTQFLAETLKITSLKMFCSTGSNEDDIVKQIIERGALRDKVQCKEIREFQETAPYDQDGVESSYVSHYINVIAGCKDGRDTDTDGFYQHPKIPVCDKSDLYENLNVASCNDIRETWPLRPVFQCDYSKYKELEDPELDFYDQVEFLFKRCNVAYQFPKQCEGIEEKRRCYVTEKWACQADKNDDATKDTYRKLCAAFKSAIKPYPERWVDQIFKNY